MRLYVIAWLLMGVSFLVDAQGLKESPVQPLDIKLEGRYIVDRDLNEWIEHRTDREFNNWPMCYMLDSNFIKSDIGLDLYKVTKKRIGPPLTIKNIGEKGDSVHVDVHFPDTVQIGETTYYEFFDYHLNENSAKLVSLESLRKEFFPNVNTPCVYMINKFFIFKDAEMYRLDRDFVYNVEMFFSDEITVLKDLPPFAIIRVFTRTEHNRWWQYTGR